MKRYIFAFVTTLAVFISLNAYTGTETTKVDNAKANSWQLCDTYYFDIISGVEIDGWTPYHEVLSSNLLLGHVKHSTQIKFNTAHNNYEDWHNHVITNRLERKSYVCLYVSNNRVRISDAVILQGANQPVGVWNKLFVSKAASLTGVSIIIRMLLFAFLGSTLAVFARSIRKKLDLVKAASSFTATIPICLLLIAISINSNSKYQEPIAWMSELLWAQTVAAFAITSILLRINISLLNVLVTLIITFIIFIELFGLAPYGISIGENSILLSNIRLLAIWGSLLAATFFIAYYLDVVFATIFLDNTGSFKWASTVIVILMAITHYFFFLMGFTQEVKPVSLFSFYGLVFVSVSFITGDA